MKAPSDRLLSIVNRDTDVREAQTATGRRMFSFFFFLFFGGVVLLLTAEGKALVLMCVVLRDGVKTF